MRIIIITAGFILILAFNSACTGNEPTEEPDPLNVAKASSPTAQPAGHPAPTGNICWRTPAVQEQLIQNLNIPSCQLINEM